jgi:hypothetical protein
LHVETSASTCKYTRRQNRRPLQQRDDNLRESLRSYQYRMCLLRLQTCSDISQHGQTKLLGRQFQRPGTSDSYTDLPLASGQVRKHNNQLVCTFSRHTGLLVREESKIEDDEWLRHLFLPPCYLWFLNRSRILA